MALTVGIILLIILLFNTLKILKEYERAVIYRNGRVKGKKPAGPGLFCVLERMLLVDDT